jgi:hypothetical protein
VLVPLLSLGVPADMEKAKANRLRNANGFTWGIFKVHQHMRRLLVPLLSLGVPANKITAVEHDCVRREQHSGSWS